jgi:DNA-binding NarL/FixJ family response regulator
MFGYTLVQSPETLSDLHAPDIVLNTDNLTRTKILVIDNEDVPQVGILYDRGFSIRHVRDLDIVDMASPYDILLVDIRGVGLKFESPLEGAYLAKKIKEAYPHKKVIIYTGSTFDSKYNDAVRFCDGSLSKDAGTDDWEEKIKEMIRALSNPVSQWKAVRSRLLENDVSIFLVYQLEQSYIRAIKQSNPRLFPDDELLKKLPVATGKMLTSIATSIAFHVLGVPRPGGDV